MGAVVFLGALCAYGPEGQGTLPVGKELLPVEREQVGRLPFLSTLPQPSYFSLAISGAESYWEWASSSPGWASPGGRGPHPELELNLRHRPGGGAGLWVTAGRVSAQRVFRSVHASIIPGLSWVAGQEHSADYCGRAG